MTPAVEALTRVLEGMTDDEVIEANRRVARRASIIYKVRFKEKREANHRAGMAAGRANARIGRMR